MDLTTFANQSQRSLPRHATNIIVPKEKFESGEYLYLVPILNYFFCPGSKISGKKDDIFIVRQRACDIFMYNSVFLSRRVKKSALRNCAKLLHFIYLFPVAK